MLRRKLYDGWISDDVRPAGTSPIFAKKRMNLFQNITDTATLSTKTKKLLKLEIAQYDYTNSLIKIDEMVQSCSFNTEQCDMEM